MGTKYNSRELSVCKVPDGNKQYYGISGNKINFYTEEEVINLVGFVPETIGEINTYGIKEIPEAWKEKEVALRQEANGFKRFYYIELI